MGERINRSSKMGALREKWKDTSHALLLPIRLTMIYLIASVCVYAFGPFEWITYRPVLFYGLLICYMAALWFGYRVGLMGKERVGFWTENWTETLIKVVSILVIVNFVQLVLNVFRDYGFSKLDIIGLAKQMWIGITNPGLGYSLRYVRVSSLEGVDVIGGTLLTLFNYLWAFLRYPVCIFAMLYFKKMKLYGKIFMVAYLVLLLVYYLSIGTTIDVFTVFLYLELPVILSTFSKWHHKQIRKSHIVRLILTMLAGMLIIFSYFTWMMISRGGINAYENPEYNVGGIGIDIGQTEEPDIITPVPDDTQDSLETPGTTPDGTETPSTTPDGTETPAPAPDTSTTSSGLQSVLMKFWISFSSYWTQGYYGFSQAVSLPWTPMFGVGNSMFLVDFITDHVYDIQQYTYQQKIQEAYGWDSRIQWHSIYTWLANDVSLYGVIIVMAVIGILFGCMFKDAITTGNPFAKASIFYFITLVLFIPGNNQLGQRPDTLFSFILIVLCWLLNRYPVGPLKKLLRR